MGEREECGRKREEAIEGRRGKRKRRIEREEGESENELER